MRINELGNVESVEYKTMSEVTVERIREAIITGTLNAGARITESDVSERLGVSRVVVREAFLMLVREGLLVKERNRFTRIVDFDRQDVADVFDLRIAIEQAAIKSCIEKNVPVRELAERATDVSKANSQPEFSFIDLMYKDIAFHDTLVRHSGNTRLINVWEETQGPILMLLYQYITRGGESMHYSHREVIDTIGSGDVDAARRAIANHIEDTKQALLERYS